MQIALAELSRRIAPAMRSECNPRRSRRVSRIVGENINFRPESRNGWRTEKTRRDLGGKLRA